MRLLSFTMVGTRSKKQPAAKPTANPYPELKSLVDVDSKLRQLALNAAERKKVQGEKQFRAKIKKRFARLDLPAKDKNAPSKTEHAKLKAERDGELEELDQLVKRSQEHDRLLAYRLATYGSDSEVDSSDDDAEAVEAGTEEDRGRESAQHAEKAGADVEATALQQGLGLLATVTARRPAKAVPLP